MVGAEVDREAIETFQAARGVPPTPPELEALHRVWLDNEVLYREGLAMQVDKGDPAIRERVIFKALSVVDSNVVLPAASDELLRGWFESHRDKYDEPARFDFDEAALTGTGSEATVREFVDALNAGAPGDAQAGLRVFKGRPRANLVESYGPEVGQGLDSAPPGVWQALHTTSGWRAMRLNARTPAKPAISRRYAEWYGKTGWTPKGLSSGRQRCAPWPKSIASSTSAPRERGRMSTRRIRREGPHRARGSWRRSFYLAVSLLFLASPASAHEMSMAEMEAHEVAPGNFVWLWSASNDKRPMGSDLMPRWPTHCTADANAVHCGQAGLRGTLSIDGVGDRYSAALVKIVWLDGQSHVYTLTRAQPAVELYGSADDRRGVLEIFRVYLALGMQHIASGVDHLLFVVSLLFLVAISPPANLDDQRVHVGA